jgi:arginine/lysine/ornithine decarboxylase
LIADGDLVLFDRNYHKAAYHCALLMAACPVYPPTGGNPVREHY